MCKPDIVLRGETAFPEKEVILYYGTQTNITLKFRIIFLPAVSGCLGTLSWNRLPTFTTDFGLVVISPQVEFSKNSLPKYANSITY